MILFPMKSSCFSLYHKALNTKYNLINEEYMYNAKITCFCKVYNSTNCPEKIFTRKWVCRTWFLANSKTKQYPPAEKKYANFLL